MKNYYPDNWVRVRITTGDGKQHDRILAGWYGGFGSGDSWKINSGIESVKDDAEFWEVVGQSGSIYFCHKERERLSGMTGSVLNSYISQIKEEGGNIEVVEMSHDFI